MYDISRGTCERCGKSFEIRHIACGAVLLTCSHCGHYGSPKEWHKPFVPTSQVGTSIPTGGCGDEQSSADHPKIVQYKEYETVVYCPCCSTAISLRLSTVSKEN